MNIIYKTLVILSEDEYLGINKEIEFAKGKFKIKKSFKDFLYQTKRNIKFIKNKNK